jgi:predicted Zn finger-like uncharacterized protein
MRLTCPKCHTEYEVPDAALAGRVRTLRCGNCGAEFKAPALPAAVEIPTEAPPELPLEPAESLAPVPETAAAEPIEPPAKLAAVLYPPIPPKPVQAAPMRAAPMRAAPDRALGISLLVLVLIIALVLAEHRAIGQAWPPSLRLFNALGLH